MNIFNSLLPQLVKYDVHTTRKINSIHAIFYHILSFYSITKIHYRVKSRENLQYCFIQKKYENNSSRQRSRSNVTDVQKLPGYNIVIHIFTLDTYLHQVNLHQFVQ